MLGQQDVNRKRKQMFLRVIHLFTAEGKKSDKEYVLPIALEIKKIR